MKENQKVYIKNLTNYDVGFGCVNFPNHYNLASGQTLPIRWEHVEDASFGPGMRYLYTNGYLKIMPQTENYEEIMDYLQLSSLKEIIDNSLSYEDAKRILSISPISTQYGAIKKHLKEGTEATKKNLANAALDLKIKDYTINTAIKAATNIDVLKTLELQEEPEKEE